MALEFLETRAYLDSWLNKTLAHLGLGADSSASALRARLPSSIEGALRDDAPPREPTGLCPLAWGDYDPRPAVAVDCVRAGLDPVGFGWVGRAINEKLASLLLRAPVDDPLLRLAPPRESAKTTAHKLLGVAVDWIESYINAGPRSWLGITFDGLIMPDVAPSMSLWGEPTWPIDENLAVVVPDNGGLSGGWMLRWSVDGENARPPWQEDTAWTSLGSCLTLMRLQFAAPVQYPRIEWLGYWEHWESVGENNGDNDEPARCWIPPVEFDAAKWETLRRRWPTWSTQRAEILDPAIERFEEAVLSPEPTSTIASAISSMESTVASRERKSDKRDALTRRVPQLIGTDSGERLLIEELLGRLYTPARSGKAHTDSVKQRLTAIGKVSREKGVSIDEFAAQLLGYASRCILTMHDQLSEDRTLKEVFLSLDRA